ncbi:methyltransferase domain-containing protein [Nocardioides ungokensis]|uniref:methyltransferase domain-containing protein n=1 Tax=Nocardioides ungokensis TaxID=1643322 RepID=UPI001C60CA7F|nr:methyltransferase domain-containing protein [Nocardioides ungokensis]
MGTLETERPADYLARLAASDLGRAYKALVVDEMDVAAGHHVLDLGCGPGADLAAFAAAVGPEGRVMGLDSDPDAVREAEHLATAWPQVTVEHGDVHSLRLPDHSVHRVHTDRVLQHVEDPDVAVGEVARVLAPSGLACFAEPDWDTLVIDHPRPRSPRPTAASSPTRWCATPGSAVGCRPCASATGCVSGGSSRSRPSSAT